MLWESSALCSSSSPPCRAQEARHKVDVKKFRQQQTKEANKPRAAGKAAPADKKPPKAPKKAAVSGPSAGSHCGEKGSSVPWGLPMPSNMMNAS